VLLRTNILGSICQKYEIKWSTSSHHFIPLLDNTTFYAPVGIWTHNPSNREAADPRNRLRDEWDRPS
jgi:hypothetical protein